MAEPATAPVNNRHYFLGLFVVVHLINYVDRQLPGVLLPAIREDLALNDTQLGFITGLAFAFFYAFMGVPLGRAADRFSRRNLVVICTAAWSVMTALTAASATFLHLAFARFGVAIGEAGLAPAAHSLISDHFEPKRRATAFGIYALGVPLGTLVSFVIGGWLNDLIGWRMTFVVIGAPGVILAALVAFTLREPKRGGIEQRVDPGIPPPFKDVLKTLWRTRSYRHCLLGTAFSGLVYTAVNQWATSYLSRSYGLTPGEVGPLLGLMAGIGGGIGGFAGGYLADRLRDRDVRWICWLPVAALSMAALPGTAAYLVGSGTPAIMLMAVPLILIPSHLACFSFILQGLAPVRMRSSFPAISLLFSAFVGLGLGPQLVGVISDLLRDAYGEESLRYALAMVVPVVTLWAATHWFMGSRTIRDDLARAAEDHRTTQ